jgi:predicted ATP-binding protein involved in virulence
MEKQQTSCYFLSLTLENIACFGKKQKLNLTDKNGDPYRWTIILGDNGTGKTTLLRSLVGISPGYQKGINFINYNLGWNFSRNDNKALAFCSYKIGYSFEENIKHEIFEATSGFRGDFKGGYIHEGDSVVNDLNFIVHAYGASRIMQPYKITEKKSRSAFSNIFLDDYPLINAEEWLLQADYLAVKDNKFKRYKRQVEDIILNLLPDVSEIKYEIKDKEPQVLFKTSFGFVSLKDLSLGYRTMLAWMVDFAAMLFERYPKSKNPLAEPAVLLVDEIDLHLHPKWQKTLIDFLNERFPNTQFIATAHSPLLVQEAADYNLVLLEKKGSNIIINNDPVSIKNWRIDQILTSDLFGIKSERPMKTQKLLDKRTKILSKSKITEKEKKKISEIEKELDYIPYGDSQEEIKADFLIQEVLKKVKTK